MNCTGFLGVDEDLFLENLDELKGPPCSDPAVWICMATLRGKKPGVPMSKQTDEEPFSTQKGPRCLRR